MHSVAAREQVAQGRWRSHFTLRDLQVVQLRILCTEEMVEGEEGELTMKKARWEGKGSDMESIAERGEKREKTGGRKEEEVCLSIVEPVITTRPVLG